MREGQPPEFLLGTYGKRTSTFGTGGGRNSSANGVATKGKRNSPWRKEGKASTFEDRDSEPSGLSSGALRRLENKKASIARQDSEKSRSAVNDSGDRRRMGSENRDSRERRSEVRGQSQERVFGERKSIERKSFNGKSRSQSTTGASSDPTH